MIVIDASVLHPALVDDEDAGDRARARLLAEDMHAPDHLDIETIAAIRNGWRRGEVDEVRAVEGLDDLAALSIERYPPHAYVDRIWELRHNVTPYDAAYVALAEALDAPLVTADRRLKDAPGPTCEIELMS